MGDVRSGEDRVGANGVSICPVMPLVVGEYVPLKVCQCGAGSRPR